jgi:DNA polymerase-1
MATNHTSPAVMRVIFALQSKSKSTERNGDVWICQCPAHHDEHPSFAVEADPLDGKALIHCRAGCTQDAVIAALGILPKDLFLTQGESNNWGAGGYSPGRDVNTRSAWKNGNNRREISADLGGDLKNDTSSSDDFSSPPSDDGQTTQDTTGEAIGLTLDDYAEAKKLPKEFLQRLGLGTIYLNGFPVVSIPYKDAEGIVRATQFRLAMHEGAHEDGRFRWSRKGTTPLLYGLWRTEALSSAKDIILTEGASDCQTLWNFDIPALGLPGANAWKDTWAKALDSYERVYIVREPDKGGEAVEDWVAASAIRHRVWFIDLGRFKDPSGLYLDSPGIFLEKWGEAVSHATSWAEAYHAKLLKEVASLYQDIKPLLESKDLLTQLRTAIKDLGYVGDAWAPMLTYLILTSRLLDRPMNGAIIGPPSVGKNVVVDIAREFLPIEECHAFEASSPRALIFDDTDLRHKAVVVGELDSLPDDGPAGSAVRSLAQNNQTVYDVVEKDSKTGKFRTRRICLEGPTVLLTTGTKSPAPQLQTRMLEIHLQDDPQLTHDIIERQSEERGLEDLKKPDLQPWKNLQKLLALQTSKVRIPFAKAIAKALRKRVIRAPTRLRRDYPKLLTCIEVITLLYQLQRSRTTSGDLLATLADYDQARNLLEPVFGSIVTDGVTTAIRQTVAGVKALLGDDPPEDKTVSESALGKHLQLAKTATHYRVRRCLDGGWLINQEDRRGRAARLTLGIPLPEDTPILPTVQDIEDHWPGHPSPDSLLPSPPLPTVDQSVNGVVSTENWGEADRPNDDRSNEQIVDHLIDQQLNHDVATEMGGRSSVLLTPPDVPPSPLTPEVGPRQPSSESLLSIEVGINGESPSYTYIREASQLERVLPAILEAETLGIDSETTGLDPLVDRVRLLQIATPDQVFMIDSFTCPLEVLSPMFHGDRWLVFHNAKFDIQMLTQYGLPWPTARLLDTQLSAQVLGAGKGAPAKGTYSLERLTEHYLNQALDKSLQGSDWTLPELSREQLAYAAKDAFLLHPLAAALVPILRQDSLLETATLESACTVPFAAMELAGLPIDVQAWEALAAQQEKRAIDLRDELYALAREAINWNSWQQILPVLHDRGIAVDSTSEDALIPFITDDVVMRLLEYRKASKAVGTYGMKWLDHVHPKTGRVHSDFFQLGTGVGRSSSHSPNVQNLPRGATYRQCIRVYDPRCLIKADYSMLHLRIASVMAPDTAMQEAFRNGEDLHRKTAAGLLHKALEQMTPGDRQLAKALNFGLIYSMGARRLQKQAYTDYGVRLTEEEAMAHKAAWFRLYPGIGKWHSREQYAISADRLTETRSYHGRRRTGITYLPDRLSSPVLGTEADGMKAAMVTLFKDRKAFPSAVVVNCIHDELLIECDREEAEDVKLWVKRHMEDGMQEAVKHKTSTPVEVHIGQSWGGA